MGFQVFCKELEEKIKASYLDGVSLEVAEKLAGEFLAAMMAVADEIKTTGLDARMRKSGLKSIRAGAYLDIVQKADKKPTESQIDAMITNDKLVGQEQDALDKAEVALDHLERYYDIFQNAHIHYRGISKGRFE